MLPPRFSRAPADRVDALVPGDGNEQRPGCVTARSGSGRKPRRRSSKVAERKPRPRPGEGHAEVFAASRPAVGRTPPTGRAASASPAFSDPIQRRRPSDISGFEGGVEKHHPRSTASPLLTDLQRGQANCRQPVERGRQPTEAVMPKRTSALAAVANVGTRELVRLPPSCRLLNIVGTAANDGCRHRHQPCRPNSVIVVANGVASVPSTRGHRRRQVLGHGGHDSFSTGLLARSSPSKWQH